MKKTNSQLDDPVVADRVRDLITQGETNTSIAQVISKEFVKVSRDAIRRFRRRHQLQDAQYTSEVHITENEASITVKESYNSLNDPDSMLEERGLSPEEWRVDSAVVNEWGPVEAPNKQLRLNLKRRVESVITPARSDGWKAPPRRALEPDKPKRLVIVADQQAPYHHLPLHERFCEWLRKNKPDMGIVAGDLLDFPDISRHPFSPETNATANECVQGGYDILRGYVHSAPNTHWQMLVGNHDERLRNYVINNARELYGLKRASPHVNLDAEVPVFSVPHLLRLDELGIDYVDPHGPYANAQIKISKYLGVRHGWIASKGSGSSALATLKHLKHSIIVAHTHRQSLVYETVHDIDQNPTTLVAAETGCMCNIDNHANKGDKNVAYTVSPDWQQGFLTVDLYPDGRFKIDTALFVNGNLYWRDERY